MVHVPMQMEVDIVPNVTIFVIFSEQYFFFFGGGGGVGL